MNHRIFISHSSKDAMIAQLICHRLEEDGIRCWIAPRDIGSSDWAGSIMDGLAHCDVCVIIISLNSIDSGEVLKEVTEATRLCSYILPFKLDRTELNMRLQYHLGPCHWLDASNPPIEERIIELKNRIAGLSDEDAVYINTKQLKLKDHMVWPKSTFLGREKEIEALSECLKSNNVAFLYGMGGIGKSEIAKEYAKLYQDQYDTTIFVGYNGSIRELVCSEAISVENLSPWDTLHESEEQYYERKMTAIRNLATERTLIILDNFDTDFDPDFFEFVNGKYHLVVTSRNRHESYPEIFIGVFQEFDLVRELFQKSYGKTLREGDLSAIDEMLRLVNCHTITVELLAKQMKASRKKPADFLELLRKVGINTGLREKVKQEGIPVAESAFEYISTLFQSDDLNEDSVQILKYMLMVPYTGIDIVLFYDICQLDTYDVLNDLIDHSWLMLDEETDILSMHPIIADVVRNQLKPDIYSCKEYIAGLHREVGSLWWKTYAERTTLWPYFEHIIRYYFNPIPELWYEFGYMANNAWICNHYKIAIETGHRNLSFVQENFPEDHEKIGQAALWLGGCYHNSGDDMNAELWYEFGLEEQRIDIAVHESESAYDQMALSCQKVARCARFKGDYKKSRTLLEESVRIYDQKCPDGIISKGNAYLELERLYIILEDYEQALEYCKLSKECYDSVLGSDNPNTACSLTDMGICHMKLRNYTEANSLLQASLELNIKFNGENNIQTYDVRKSLAELHYESGNIETAVKMYQELELKLEDGLGENNPYVVSVRDRRQEMERLS